MDNAIERLIEYRENYEKYLPLVDHETTYFEEVNEFGDYNIGWDMGFIGNRPYFLECWATEGLTMLSIFISVIGIEDYTIPDLEKLLIEEGHIYTKKDGYESPEQTPIFTDGNGNEFFSINIVVGIGDGPELIGGGNGLVPFSLLNEMNDFEESEE